jgi:hypothetical protein
MNNELITYTANKIKTLYSLPNHINSEIKEPEIRYNTRLTSKKITDFEQSASFEAFQKLKFLWKNPGFTINAISSYYPHSSKSLIKWKSILNWSCIALNEQIKWNQEMVIEFHDRLPTCSFEVEVDPEGIECSNNPSFPWTVNPG